MTTHPCLRGLSVYAGDITEVLEREQLLLAIQQIQARLALPAKLTIVLCHTVCCCLGQEDGADDRLLQDFLLLENRLPLVGTEHIH